MRQLRQEFVDSLKERFNVIEIIDLFFYDSCPEVLKSKLLSLKKDTFEKNDRIVFLHFDTEFYLYPNKPGLLLTNLVSMLNELDIPAWFTLLITNQPQLREKVKQARSSFSKDDCNIPVVFCNFQKLLINQTESIIDLPLNEELIEKNFVCLNGAKRFHRKALVTLLEHNDMITNGLVSYKS
jgi:hypothetical protein